MFKWAVYTNGFGRIDEGDWGRDVVTTGAINEINHISLFTKGGSINIFPEKGVITIGDRSIRLGVSKDGYSYHIGEETISELTEIIPVTTAEYDINDNAATDVDRHLVLTYKVTHLKKFSKKEQKLAEPILKSFYIKLDHNGYISVC